MKPRANQPEGNQPEGNQTEDGRSDGDQPDGSPTDGYQTDNMADQLAKFDDLLQSDTLPPSTSRGETSTTDLESTILRLERHWPRTPKRAQQELDSKLDAPPREVKIGRFEIQREIGRGGFGVVFLARDPQLNRLVALKVPRPDAFVDEERQRRFASEAALAASLDHPAIVPIYEANPHGPTPYIASAYCPGPDLGRWLAGQESPAPPKQVAKFVASLAEAVQYAHEQGVFHRDLKPGNVLLEPADLDSSGLNSAGLDSKDNELANFRPKLTDFGLAKLVEDSLQDTHSSLLVGTPLYMAPEQLSGDSKHANPATDVYSLGVLLFELLTLRTPFEGSSYVEVLDNLRNQEPLRPSNMNSDVPIDLETICLKCLEKDSADRYASADELCNDLERFLAGESPLATPPSWRDRLRRWTRRPERIKEAGRFTYRFQIVIVVWIFMALLIGLPLGSFSEGTVLRTFAEALLASFTSHLPLAWLGWLIAKGRMGGFWPAAIGSILFIGIFVYSLTHESVAFEHFYPTVNSKVSVYVGLILGSLLQTGLYVLAIPAWLRQRHASR